MQRNSKSEKTNMLLHYICFFLFSQKEQNGIDTQWWLVSNLAFVSCTKQTRVSVESTVIVFVLRYAVIS